MLIWKKLVIPLPINLLLFIVLWGTKPFIVALSFLVGALLCWFGELCFTALLSWKIERKRPKGFVWFFAFAEMIKLALFAILFVIAIEVFRFHLLPTFAGFLFNLIFFWIYSFKALGSV